MSANTLKTYQTVRPILKTYPSESPRPQKHREHSPRFDIFKGTRDKTGKVVRVKSVGCAFLHPTTMNYTVFLRTFINDVFYLLKETINPAFGDYAILTRIPARNPNRKFFWNNVGEGRFLVGPNKGLLHLKWDLLGTSDIYMSMEPEVRAAHPNRRRH